MNNDIDPNLLKNLYTDLSYLHCLVEKHYHYFIEANDIPVGLDLMEHDLQKLYNIVSKDNPNVPNIETCKEMMKKNSVSLEKLHEKWKQMGIPKKGEN